MFCGKTTSKISSSTIYSSRREKQVQAEKRQQQMEKDMVAEAGVRVVSSGKSMSGVSTPDQEEKTAHAQGEDDDVFLCMFEYNRGQDSKAMQDLLQLEVVNLEEHHCMQNQEIQSKNANIVKNHGYIRGQNVINKPINFKQQNLELLQNNIECTTQQLFYGSSLKYNATYKMLCNYYKCSHEYLSFGLFFPEKVKQKVMSYIGETFASQQQIIISNHIALPPIFQNKLGQQVSFTIVAKKRCCKAEVLIVYLDNNEFIQLKQVFFILLSSCTKSITYDELQEEVNQNISSYEPVEQIQEVGIVGRLEKNGIVIYKGQQ
eukprot:TRINITY_DN26493_c0_g1_i1.p1 TRINITY_DN26493_c0_g1~~TRINITY_DN26493_c0_g1_i1.p1  ORF type:complete len:318 (-),score=18.34 TRINITY_DN26493_c0_g1_i1:273-1226(-)